MSIEQEDTTEVYLNSLFQNSPEAIVLLDRNNRVVRINGEFTRLFGYREEEILGAHIDTLIAGSDKIEEAGRYSRLAESGQKLSAESIRYHKDGSPVQVSILGAPVVIDGEIIGIFGIYRDITARKNVENKLEASERRYRSLIEDAPVGIFRSSSKGHVLSANSYAAQILGFESAETAKAYYNDLATQFYLKPFWRVKFLHELETHGQVTNFDAAVKRYDGSTIWITLNARVSEYFEDGEFIIDGFLSDTTEIKQTRERLEQSLSDKEVLLQEVHHRVKNNMQIITSILNLEAEKLNNPQAESVLLTSQSRISAMSLIHEKLYNAEDVSSVNLKDYIQSLCYEIRNFTYSSMKSSPAFSFHLEQVYAGIDFAIPFGLILNELIINSYKHAFEGIESPEITVRLSRTDSGIRLKVGDNGVGVPPGDDFSDPKTLGMQLLRSLVDQLKGEFSISSHNGTKYDFHFPLQ